MSILSVIRVPIVVDCRQPLSKMINRGNYDFVHHQVTKDYFPVRGTGIFRKLISILELDFDRTVIRQEDAVWEMMNHGYFPARIEELLALGEQFPRFQSEFSIVSLGSFYHPEKQPRLVPFLNNDSGQRTLEIAWLGRIWRFAAIDADDEPASDSAI